MLFRHLYLSLQDYDEYSRALIGLSDLEMQKPPALLRGGIDVVLDFLLGFKKLNPVSDVLMPDRHFP